MVWSVYLSNTVRQCAICGAALLPGVVLHDGERFAHARCVRRLEGDQ